MFSILKAIRFILRLKNFNPSSEHRSQMLNLKLTEENINP
jgi:hypothetical protein